MQRRSVAAALGLLGTLGVTGSAALSEALRMSVLDRFGVEEDWDDVMEQLGRSFMVSPAAEAHGTIGGYLFALSGQPVTPSTHGAASRLMLLRATTTANLGDMRQAAGWYRAARRMADDSGDIRLVTFIRGREATRRGYEDATPANVLHLTAGLDCTEAHLARAQAFARLGERSQALSALADAERAYPRTEQAEDTVYGFQPWRFSLAEAYVWAILGEVERAQSEASSANLPNSLPRFQAQRDLTSAVALARSGDITHARAEAQRVIDSHPIEHRSMILTSMLGEVGL